MKLVFFTNRMTKGGSERVISYLANGLCKDYDVDIVTMTCAKSDYELSNAVHHIPLELEPEKNNHALIANVRRIRRLKKYITNNRDATFVSFVTLPSYILLLFRKCVKGRIIVTVRNDPKEQHKHLYDRMLVRWLYPQCDALICQTEEAEQYYSDLPIRKKIILPNPLNERFIKVPFPGERKKCIVNVGRLIEQKNQRLLIKAFSKLDERFKEYKLVIYGEGRLKESLQFQIDQLHLNGRVILAGAVADIENVIYDASLFVLSSDFEGMPNALLEAMCLGLPAISTDCSGGGPRSVIQNGVNGILVECGNQYELVEAIEKVLCDRDYADALSQNASKISSIYSPASIIQQWREFIETV